MAGFLGRVDSETRCTFWAEEPADHGFDPLRLPVFGTRKPLLKSHSNSAGFDPGFAHLLTEASATHPAFGRAGSRHGRHPHDRW